MLKLSHFAIHSHNGRSLALSHADFLCRRHLHNGHRFDPSRLQTLLPILFNSLRSGLFNEAALRGYYLLVVVLVLHHQHLLLSVQTA